MNGSGVIVVIGVREHVLKDPDFSRITSMLKHYREVGGNRRHSYIKAFPRRYAKIEQFLSVVRVYPRNQYAIKKVNQLLHTLSPNPAIIDDKIYNTITYPNKVREGEVRKKYLKRLITIADNLANYLRILQNNNPKKFRQEIQRIKK